MEPTITKKERKVLLWAFISLMLCSIQGYAQLRPITGKVTGVSDGQAVPSAAVKVKGKQGGTSTNLQGTFSISASTGDVLEITSVGYQRKEVRVGRQCHQCAIGR